MSRNNTQLSLNAQMTSSPDLMFLFQATLFPGFEGHRAARKERGSDRNTASRSDLMASACWVVQVAGHTLAKNG